MAHQEETSQEGSKIQYFVFHTAKYGYFRSNCKHPHKYHSFLRGKMLKILYLEAFK